MSNLFSAYAEEQLENQTIPAILTGKLNPFEFITSTDKLYLREDPTPFQRVVIKTFYGLWPLYPPDQEEASIIRVLRENWKVTIDLECQVPIDTLILVLGRRSTKSTIMSYFATVAMYELLHLENPQLYYHIRERHPIHITHVAAAGKQAEEVFSFTSNNLRRAEFFRPYIDFDKDNSTELRLFSPFDLTLNRQIDYRNSLVLRGKMKESRLPGSLLIESITTSAATARGKAIILLMMSEYSHFQRAKQDLNKSDEQIASENPQTDYAILKALVPSVKDFVPDGKVVLESSPREKGGEHYHQYCIGGGMEQENLENITPEPGYQVIQAATWEARPTITYESLASEFRKDPVGANMEWGGHFGNPSGQFISEALITAVPIAVRPLIRVNPGTYQFVLAIDPGGKAKKKKADTYAMAWGHSEGGPIEKNVHYYVDGMHGFDAQVRNLGMGKIEKIPVNPNEVVGYLVDLINDLGGKNHIMEIVYDQWECLKKDTLIDTDKGLITIGELYTRQRGEVFSIWRQGKMYRVKKIIHNGVQDAYRVDTKFGYSVCATDNHRFKFRPYRTAKGDWLYVRDLQQGDSIEIESNDHWSNQELVCMFTPTKRVYNKKTYLPKTITVSLGRFLGYLVAEGNVYTKPGGTGSQVVFSNKNRELLADFESLSLKLFERNAVRLSNQTGTVLSSVEVAEFVDYLGYRDGAYNKEVPWSILQSSKEVVVEFLRAYFEGDGGVCIHKADRSVNCWSVSEVLIRQIQILLTKFGIVSSIHPFLQDAPTRTAASCTLWTLNIRGNNVLKYASQIGFISSRKKALLELCAQEIPQKKCKQKKRYFREDGIYVDTITGIQYAGKEEVFDLQVESDEHAFVANGFVSHNSSAPIATLQSFGMPAFETTFTNEYKAGMYQNFLERVQEGRVHMYGIDVGLWIERWKLEMKFLQQDTSGRYTFYHHPSSGPVQTDDFADVVAQLVHRLVLRVAPTKDSVAEARKHGTGPIRMVRTIKPTRGGPLWGGTNIIRTRRV